MKLVVFTLTACIFVYSVNGIIGGNKLENLENTKYLVAILSDEKYVSTGIYIKSNVVLTDITAHRQLLLKHTSPYSVSLSVRAGSLNSEEGGHVIKVRNSMVITTDLEDFSVLFLEEHFNGIHIKLADKTPSLDTKCQIYGWGANDANYSYPPNLLTADVTLVSSLKCAAKHNSTETTDGELCIQGGDACVGDSGSPLVCNGELVGIASSLPHCSTEFGGSYIDIQKLKDDIMKTIE